MPGVAGALVNAANSKPVAALLGPLAKAYGDYWGELAEERLARKRERRRQNTYEMIERVLEAEQFSKPADDQTEEDEQLQFDWTTGAEKVDPHRQPELAALWQGLLGRILRKEDDTAEMISVLKQLTAADARLLLIMPKGLHRPEEGLNHRYEKLENLDLVSRFSPINLKRRNTVINIFSAALFVVSFYGLLIVAKELAPSAFNYNLQVIVPIGLICVIMMANIPALLRIGSFQLTPLGLVLRASGKKYIEAGSE